MVKERYNVFIKNIYLKLDKIVSEIVKKRDLLCVTCGTGSNLTPGHLFSRVGKSTRWDLDNVFAQCLVCNLNHERGSTPMVKFFKKKFGEEKYFKLLNRYHQPKKFTDYMLEELYNDLKKELSLYEKK